MLDRQGVMMNLKKLRQLCREEKLPVRGHGGRKRALGTRRPMVLPDAANQRWSHRAIEAKRLYRELQSLAAPLSADCVAIACRTADEFLSEALFWYVGETHPHIRA
jgi:putative transposase